MELGAQEAPAALQDGPLPLVVGPGEDDGIDVNCRRAAQGSSFDPRENGGAKLDRGSAAILALRAA